MIRLLALLLLVGCAPDRVGLGADYVNQRDSMSSSFSGGKYDDMTSNVVDVDTDPYWVGKVWAEWDYGTKDGVDLGYLHRHEEYRPVPSLPQIEPDPHEDHSWWQEQIESVLKFDADKLLIIALLAMFFKKDIAKWWPWKKKEGE